MNMATTRRHFISGAPAGVLGVPGMAAMQSRKSPNDRIRIATIGIGAMGLGDTRSSLANTGVERRVEETRCTVDFPWLCPPFPASCPFRSIMAHRGLPPHRPHRADFPQRVLQADSPPLLRCLLLVRGR